MDMDLYVSGSVGTKDKGKNPIRNCAKTFVTRRGLSHINYEMAGGGWFIKYGSGWGLGSGGNNLVNHLFEIGKKSMFIKTKQVFQKRRGCLWPLW